jgi:hypothetical protein
MDQFACYRCTYGGKEFQDVVEHSINHHASEVLKVRSKELNVSTGKLGFRTHNFTIIPKDKSKDTER